jgi:hypothetical protein
MEYNQFMEALKGKQKKLDKNHNGEIDSQDLKIVRNEETESLDEASTTTTQRTDTNRPTYDVHSKATGNHIGTIYTPSKTNPKHQTTVYDSTGKIHKKGEHDTLKDAHNFIKTSRGIKEEAEELDEIHRMKTKLNKLDPFSAKSVARQKLSNLMKSGKAKGALIANKMRTLNMGDDMDQEDLEALHEVLSKDAKAGDWIHDFVHSENPKFEGKTKKERIKMALGAYYGKQNEAYGSYRGYRSSSGASHGHAYGGSGFGRREREDDEYHVPDPVHKPQAPTHAPVAPVPDKKYIKGTPENKALKASRKPINGHPTNEEVEQIEEKSEQAKQNKAMKNMMDTSRGARYKLNNPVPDADPEHKTAQAHNKAIGRALRNEDKMTTQKDKNGKLISFKYEGDWKKSTENKEGSGKAANLAGQAMQKMKQANEAKEDPAEYDQEGDMAKTQLRSIKYHADELHEMLGDNDNLPEWVQSKLTLAQDYLQTVCDYMYSKDEVNEAAYAGLEKEDKPGKVKTAIVKLHPKGVGSETVEGWKDPKKPVAEAVQKVDVPAYLRKAKGDTPLKMDDLKRKDTISDPENLKRNSSGVKESFDNEGNLIPHKISYKDFITEIKLADLPVRRIQGHSYGANYSDPEGADDYDDKKPMKPAAEKRGRGRPAGAKSGARKITGTSKLMNK